MAGQKGFGPFCALSFDCDFPRDVQVLPRLVEMLGRYHCTASFACVGQWIRQFPQEHRCLVEAGHELINHTDTHPNLYHPGYSYAQGQGLSRKYFNQIPPAERRKEIEDGHRAFAETLDYLPQGFRTPHFGVLHRDEVYPILVELGYRFSSSVLAASSPSSGLPFRPLARLWEIPLSPCPEHPFGVFDSWHSLSKRGAAHCQPGRLAELFARLCRRVAAQGGLVNVYFDPVDVLQSGELERMLGFLQGAPLQRVTYAELADIMERQAL
jgi:hypothetical protein